MAEKTVGLSLLDRYVYILHRQGVFLSNVNIALMRADRISADDQPLENGVRIPFEKASVHISAGVPFVCIDDHIFYFVRRIAGSFPLSPCGKAAPSPASQVGLFDFFDNLPGGHPGKGFG